MSLDDSLETQGRDALSTGYQFGEERWPIVQNIMAHFARMRIYLADVKPGNITFAESD